jgi:hypothetical protein
MLDRRQLLAGATGALAATATPAFAASDAFKLTSLALYLPDVALRERGPDAEALTAFIDAIKKAANTELSRGSPESGVSGSIVAGMKPPAKSRFWVVLPDPQRAEALLARPKGPLEAIPAPTVRGWNAVAINFDAWGGDGKPHPPAMPIPDEWLRAVPRGGGMLPDTALEAIWKD